MLVLEGMTLEPNELLDVLYKNKIVVFRNVCFSNATFLEFGKSLGELITFVDKDFHHPDNKEIFVVSDYVKVGHYWHSDSSFLQDPQPITMLWCQKAPLEGGETEFIDMVDLYESLDESLKSFLKDKRAVHDGLSKYILTSSDVGLSLEEIIKRDRKICPPVTHPVIITHPITMKKSLYVNPGFTTSVLDDTSETLSLLLELIEKGKTLKHIWKKDDLVLWDNRSVIHRASSATRGERVMFRLGVREDKFYV